MGPSVRRDDTVWLSSRPDVEHVAVLGAELVDPAQTRIGIAAGALAVDGNQRGLDVRLHLAAVAADVNDSALLDQTPDALILRRDQILHIGLRTLGSRECGVAFG